MNFGREYARWAQKSPLMSNVIVATAKTVAADILVQNKIEGKSLKNLDYQRIGIFGAFGFFYLGIVQYGIYVKGVQRVFDKRALDKFCNSSVRDKIKDKIGLKILAWTIAIDSVAIQPFIYWPSYYVTKEVGYTVTNQSNECNIGYDDRDGSGSVVSNAMIKYSNNFWQDNLGMFAFWLPMDMIIYSVPLHLRLHLNHIISFGWVGLVSIFRGAKEPVADDDKEVISENIGTR